jgi:hypothetical protein
MISVLTIVSTFAFELLVVGLISLVAAIYLLRLKFNSNRGKTSERGKVSIAFFHPHCRGGGGGERVLWKAIESISRLNQDHCKSDSSDLMRRRCKVKFEVVVYTSDPKKDNYCEGMNI